MACQLFNIIKQSPSQLTGKEAIALDEATNALNALRADIKHAQQRLAEHNKRRQLAADQQLQCEQSLEHIGRLRSQDNETLVRLHKEMLDQKAKLERAQRELKLARKTARTKIGADNASPFLAGFERLLRVRELEAANAAVMHQLAEMVDDIAGMATTVHEQLYERGLSMPERSARRSGGAGVADGRGSSECSSSWSGSVRRGRQRGGGVESSAGGVSMPLASSIDSSQTGKIFCARVDFIGICIDFAVSMSPGRLIIAGIGALRQPEYRDDRSSCRHYTGLPGCRSNVVRVQQQGDLRRYCATLEVNQNCVFVYVYVVYSYS